MTTTTAVVAALLSLFLLPLLSILRVFLRLTRQSEADQE